MYAYFLYGISSYGSDPRMNDDWLTKEELQEKYSHDQFKKSFDQLSTGQKGLIMDSVHLAQKLQMIGLRYSRSTINKFNRCACMDLVAAALYGYGPFEKPFLNEDDSPEIQKKCVEKFLSVRNVLRSLQKEFISKYKDQIKDPARNPFAKIFSGAYDMTEEESKQENDAKILARKIYDLLHEPINDESKPERTVKTDEIKSINKGIEISKFENLIDNAGKWLLPTNESYTVFCSMPFCVPISSKDVVNKYLENNFVRVIYEKCFLQKKENDIYGPKPNELLRKLSELKGEGMGVVGYVDNNGNTNTFIYNNLEIKGALIFWALLLLAISDDFYKNEINMIADLATALDFTEEMMEDWITAVKYLLRGNEFSENMSVAFVTKEANEFFKHQ